MPYTIMSYNIEHMNKMFANNTVKPRQRERAQQIARVIQDINPHVLGICEAANAHEEHRHFIETYLPRTGYRVAHGTSRGSQNLVFYYRDPFSVVAADEAAAAYDPWTADIENDGLKEQHKWERKPLEAIFRIGPNGPKLRVILVHTKSKGIFSVVDLHHFQKIALANRKRLLAQGLKFRDRLDQLLQEPDRLPTIVIGDMNDGPGLDPFEKAVGKSFVETVMGSVYDPPGIFHNALWWMKQTSEVWTADFPDPIVNHPFGYKHRVWIDHILLSPDMLRPNNVIRYVARSGNVGLKNNDSRKASDHFPVYCTVETQ